MKVNKKTWQTPEISELRECPRFIQLDFLSSFISNIINQGMILILKKDICGVETGS